MALPIFHLDNPQVGIERDLPLEAFVRIVGIDPFFLMRPRKEPIDAGFHIGRQRLRGRPIQGRTAIQTIDLDENGPGFRRPATAEDSARAFGEASSQIGGYPDVGAQTQINVRRREPRLRVVSPDER